MTASSPHHNQPADDTSIHHERMATLGALTAGIAHELNNPIGYISSNLNTLRRYIISIQGLLEQADTWIDPVHRAAWAQMLQTERWSTVRADLTDVIDETRQGAEHLKNVVGDLKTLARTSTTTEHASLDSCVASALTVLSHVVRHRCIIEQTLAAPAQRTLIRSHILQIIINLVHNACDAIPVSGGRLCLSSHQHDDHSVIIVEDNGPGISDQLRDTIFDDFYTTKATGTGLGLALARRFAKQHGGDIHYDQSPTLNGARFTVTIRDYDPSGRA